MLVLYVGGYVINKSLPGQFLWFEPTKPVEVNADIKSVKEENVSSERLGIHLTQALSLALRSRRQTRGTHRRDTPTAARLECVEARGSLRAKGPGASF